MCGQRERWLRSGLLLLCLASPWSLAQQPDEKTEATTSRPVMSATTVRPSATAAGSTAAPVSPTAPKPLPARTSVTTLVPAAPTTATLSTLPTAANPEPSPADSTRPAPTNREPSPVVTTLAAPTHREPSPIAPAPKPIAATRSVESNNDVSDSRSSTTTPVPSSAKMVTPVPPSSASSSTAEAQTRGVKIYRDGSLLNQAMPSAPTLAPRKESLPPLRQLLMTAIDMRAAEQQRKFLAQQGATIASRKLLNGLGLVVSTFNVRADVDIDNLQQQLLAQFPEAAIEKNQRYQLLFSQNQTYAQQSLGINSPSLCQQSVAIAMLDAVSAQPLKHLPKERVSFYNAVGSKTADHRHGIAIASLLAASESTFPSVLPKAQLQMVNVFSANELGDPETRTDWLLYGLNYLYELEPQPLAVNLSFGGSYSALMATAIKKLSEKIILVAAAGNDGNDELVYPAAYHQVYAVGAIDAQGNKTRASNFGPHVVAVAPGEDIWTSDDNGKGFYASGTSFAAPFVTAALALVKQQQGSVSDYLHSLGESKQVQFAKLCE